MVNSEVCHLMIVQQMFKNLESIEPQIPWDHFGCQGSSDFSDDEVNGALKARRNSKQVYISYHPSFARFVYDRVLHRYREERNWLTFDSPWHVFGHSLLLRKGENWKSNCNGLLTGMSAHRWCRDKVEDLDWLWWTVSFIHVYMYICIY